MKRYYYVNLNRLTGPMVINRVGSNTKSHMGSTHAGHQSIYILFLENGQSTTHFFIFM